MTIWTQGHYDLVARALLGATQATGFDVDSPGERRGICHVRDALVDLFASCDPEFDANKFMDATQRLSSLTARDEEAEHRERDLTKNYETLGDA